MSHRLVKNILEVQTREFFIWAGLAIVGTYFMTFGFKIPNISPENKTFIAAVFALIAALGFSSSTVLSKRALKNVIFELGTYLRFAITAIIMLVIVLASGEISSISNISNVQISIFLLIAFTTGGPAIFIYYFGLKNISAYVASICELAFSLVAIALEFFVRDNILSPVQWIGAFILLVSILRVTNIRAEKEDIPSII